MNIKQLEEEIESLGIDQNNINIGVRGRYDGCFNLLHRKNGKWEIFYGEQGKKSDAQIFNTQKEACDAFAKLLRQYLNEKELEDKPKYWKGYRMYAERYQINWITGIFIFSMLLGVFFAGYMIFTGEIDFLFWCSVGWAIVFGLLAFFTRSDRRNEAFEYFGQIFIQLFCVLLGIAIMILLPIGLIPQYTSGEINLITLIISIVILEALVAFWSYWCFKAFQIEYWDDIKEYFEEKKAKAKERKESDDPNRSEDNP